MGDICPPQGPAAVALDAPIEARGSHAQPASATLQGTADRIDSVSRDRTGSKSRRWLLTFRVKKASETEEAPIPLKLLEARHFSLILNRQDL